MIDNSSNQDNNLGFNLPTYTQSDDSLNFGDAITPQIAGINSSLDMSSDFSAESEMIFARAEPNYNYSNEFVDGLDLETGILASSYSKKALDNSSQALLSVDRAVDEEIRGIDNAVNPQDSSKERKTMYSPTVLDSHLLDGFLNRDDLNVSAGDRFFYRRIG